MMFMSTLTKNSRLKSHLVAKKAEEKKRKEIFNFSNKMTSHLLMEMQLIYFQIFYFIFQLRMSDNSKDSLDGIKILF